MAAGEHRAVTFRLVPKRRKVKIVAGDGFDESKQDRQDKRDKQDKQDKRRKDHRAP